MNRSSHEELGKFARLLMLTAAFLGWMLAGVIMAIIPLAGRAAVRSMAACCHVIWVTGSRATAKT